MTDNNIANRLKLFIDSEGISSSQFADACNIPRPSLSQFLNGRNKKISDIFVTQIHDAYPKLNILWLMFGEGSMLSDEIGMAQFSAPSIPSEQNLFSDEFSGSDNSMITPVWSDSRIDSKDIPLSLQQNDAKDADLKRDELLKELSGLRSEIAKLKRSPRKVTQIMVYYDDSTFETFVPRV